MTDMTTTPTVLSEIISDAEITRVHGHANFGPTMSPRDVVNEGVQKYAIGYHSGHTQLCILLEHGLITKPRPGKYDANLTKKGKKYARALYQIEKAMLAAAPALTARHEAPASEDWIEWGGGENPAPGQRVDLIMRGEPNIVETDLSDNMRWWHDHNTDGGDIIAYRSSSHEAPAEGAGEAVLAYLNEHQPRCYSTPEGNARRTAFEEIRSILRARSAPEASPQVEAVALEVIEKALASAPQFMGAVARGHVVMSDVSRHLFSALYTHPQPAQTPGVGAWVVRSPNGNVRYWSHDEALTKRSAAKWGLEAMHEALGPSPFRPSEGEVDDALSEVSKRVPDTILHGNSFGHEGFYPHAAVKTLVAAVYSGLSSSSITATQPDRGVEAPK